MPIPILIVSIYQFQLTWHFILEGKVIWFSMETWRHIEQLMMEEPQSLLTGYFMLALSEFEQVIIIWKQIWAAINWNIFVDVHCFEMILLFLVNRHRGILTVRDNQNKILYNDIFPTSSSTIFFTKSSLTNGLNMSFSSSLDIAEIEVFGGMYEHYVPTLYNYTFKENTVKNA